MTPRLLLFALSAVLGLQSVAVWSAVPKKVPVVGILITNAAVDDPFLDHLRTGFRAYGYEDGRNIRLEPVTAGGQLDRLPKIAEDLVRSGVDIIMCPNELSVRAAQKATSTIPIVMFGFGDDPVALGLVQSLRRPGGNTTGLYSLLSETEAKRLEILKEAVPRVSRVAVLWGNTNRGALEEVKRAAPSLSLQIEPIEINGAQDLDGAFEATRRAKATAIIALWSPTTYIYRVRIAAFALKAKVPMMWPFVPAVKAGGLISYGPDLTELYRRVAYYVDRRLKGANPAELPVEQVSTFQLAVNLKTAKALGITIPESILLRADEVIR